MASLTDLITAELPDDFWKSKVLVAVSGGSDSLGLLLHLSQVASKLALAGFQLQVAHFDHQWSPESQKATILVQEVCQRLAIPCHLGYAEQLIDQLSVKVSGMPPRLAKSGPEATARFLRYEFLKRLVDPLGIRYVLTGHTKDDQVETVLMRIARGTSITGLTGVAARRFLTDRCEIVRPMLAVSRADMVQYLQEMKQPFYEDPSNLDDQLTRNRVRHQILPWLLEHLSPSLCDSLLSLQQSAVDAEVIQGFVSQGFANALLKLDERYFEVDVNQLHSAPEPLIRQVMVRWWNQANLPAREMNRWHWKKLAALVVRPSSPEDSNKEDLRQEDSKQIVWPSEFHFPGPVIAKRSRKILTVQMLSQG